MINKGRVLTRGTTLVADYCHFGVVNDDFTVLISPVG